MYHFLVLAFLLFLQLAECTTGKCSECGHLFGLSGGSILKSDNFSVPSSIRSVSSAPFSLPIKSRRFNRPHRLLPEDKPTGSGVQNSGSGLHISADTVSESIPLVEVATKCESFSSVSVESLTQGVEASKPSKHEKNVYTVKSSKTFPTTEIFPSLKRIGFLKELRQQQPRKTASEPRRTTTTSITEELLNQLKQVNKASPPGSKPVKTPKAVGSRVDTRANVNGKDTNIFVHIEAQPRQLPSWPGLFSTFFFGDQPSSSYDLRDSKVAPEEERVALKPREAIDSVKGLGKSKVQNWIERTTSSNSTTGSDRLPNNSDGEIPALVPTSGERKADRVVETDTDTDSEAAERVAASEEEAAEEAAAVAAQEEVVSLQQQVDALRAALQSREDTVQELADRLAQMEKMERGAYQSDVRAEEEFAAAVGEPTGCTAADALLPPQLPSSSTSSRNTENSLWENASRTGIEDEAAEKVQVAASDANTGDAVVVGEVRRAIGLLGRLGDLLLQAQEGTAAAVSAYTRTTPVDDTADVKGTFGDFASALPDVEAAMTVEDTAGEICAPLLAPEELQKRWCDALLSFLALFYTPPAPAALPSTLLLPAAVQENDTSEVEFPGRNNEWSSYLSDAEAISDDTVIQELQAFISEYQAQELELKRQMSAMSAQLCLLRGQKVCTDDNNNNKTTSADVHSSNFANCSRHWAIKWLKGICCHLF